MGIPLKHIQAVSKMADVLYDFLPANPHPRADRQISFPGCAQKVGLHSYWNGGSKRPAVTALLNHTLEFSRGKFSQLVIEIVQTAIPYRMTKGNPITYEEIIALNQAIQEVEFKIPELWDRSFLDNLPKNAQQTKPDLSNDIDLSALMKEYVDMTNLEAHRRGYAFQNFLNKIFYNFGLAPKSAFRIIGEELDGSFELDGNTYLLEAKWHATVTGQKDLAVFSSKVGGKSTWARGLFVSYLGYSKDGLDAFARGKQTNIVGMDSVDLVIILQGKISLTDAIRRKVRAAAETNDFFVPLYQLVS